MGKHVNDVLNDVRKVVVSILNYLYRFIFKSIVYCGICMTFELAGRFVRRGSADGFVSVPLWMIIVYMNIAWLDDVLIPLFNRKKIQKWLQAVIIMFFVFVFEFVFGVVFKYILNITVWDYSDMTFLGIKASLLGVINVYSLLPWYAIAWFLLWFYPRLTFMVDHAKHKFGYTLE